MTNDGVREVIIIGGGPAGYTAALYSARANLNPLVFEGFNWGGQLMNTTDVENYPGYPAGIMGPEMMREFRIQAERFGTEFVTDDVLAVRLDARTRLVVVDERCEQRLERCRMQTGRQVRTKLVRRRVDQVDPARTFGHTARLAGGSARPAPGPPGAVRSAPSRGGPRAPRDTARRRARPYSRIRRR